MALPPQTVDDYLQAQPPERRAVLEAVRRTVLAAVPGGEERISYRMPAVFHRGRVVVYYAAFKKHLGVYPPVDDAALKRKLAPYAGPKGNLQFPYAKPIPYDLIGAVARSRLGGTKKLDPAR